ncbi:PQQ-binding-like beta-propeller repeat protein [Natrinema sp. H-ect1]|uniref:outer membrane protein assembly factor BamB family protein n=1 Tax=Natrinema sp. H-ect1 TaxID=3242700 RepID=UPI00359ED295
MKRRSVLLATSTMGIAGCMESPTNDSTTESPNNDSTTENTGFDNPTWRYEIPGDDLTVSEGTLYGFESYPHNDRKKEKLREETDISGRVFSLNLENGERKWAHGSTAYQHEGNSNLTIEDAIYYQTNNDVTSWVSAIEFDGTERWAGSEGHSTLEGSLTHVAEGAAYVQNVTDIKVIDASEGDLLCSGVGYIYFDTAAKDTFEMVYVRRQEGSDEVVVALDADDGSVQWRYGQVDDYRVHDVFDGVVYATDDGTVIAITDGEERWRVDLSKPSGSLDILEFSSNSVFMKDDTYLYAVDISKRDIQWKQEMRSPRRRGDLRIYGDRIYVGRYGEQEVSAFGLEEGTELWDTDIGSDVESWKVVGEGTVGSEESLFVRTEKELHQVGSDGEVAQTWTPNEVIHGFAVDEFIIISTDSGIYALEP